MAVFTLLHNNDPGYTALQGRRGLINPPFASRASGIEPRSGVIAGPPNSLQVAASAGMVLSVQPGAAIVNGNGGYSTVNDAAATVTISASGASARWDLVILRVKDTGEADLTSGATLEVVKGTTTTDPALPSPRCLVLARVVVGAGVSSITSGAITDRRVWTAAAGGTIPIPGAYASTPSAVGVAVGQRVWDPTIAADIVAVSTTTWLRIGPAPRSSSGVIFGTAPPSDQQRTHTWTGVVNAAVIGAFGGGRFDIPTGFTQGLVSASIQNLNAAIGVGHIHMLSGESSLSTTRWICYSHTSPGTNFNGNLQVSITLTGA